MESQLRNAQAPAAQLEPEGNHDPTASEQRLIQVAVRCRPRQSTTKKSRGYFHGATDSDDDNDDDDHDGDGGSSEEKDGEARDSVVKYDLPDASPTNKEAVLPAVSVPSHVLALGGHGPHRRFEFDFVFPPWKDQRDIYEVCAHDAIDGVLRTAQGSALRGHGDGGDRKESEAAAHATILAYGQTGTGKTYTMGILQHADARTKDQDHGIIPRAVIHILSRLTKFNRSEQSRQQGVRLVASMSFLQIYLESIQDLFVSSSTTAASGASPTLQARLNPATNVFYVPGLSEFPIETVEDARLLLERATRNRVLAATAKNKTSSRSHTLLTISIIAQRMDGASDDGDDHDHYHGREESESDRAAAPRRRRSTVSFVDLAGSERVEGALHFLHATRKRQELRIREAKFINRSLSALGSVIAVLAAQEDRHGHRRKGHSHSKIPDSPKKKKPVPHIRFRDSQLTKLLQSRLMDGNGRLVLIATIDDRSVNLTETLSTLKFASQCRRVDLSQSHAKAADARRKQSLLKQVFDDVKTMYEEREAALRLQYESRIAELENQLHHATEPMVLPPQQQQQIAPQQHNASYVALCSLVDSVRRRQGTTAVKHPPIDAFSEEKHMVTYVAELYQQVKVALMSQGMEISTGTTATSMNQFQSAIPPRNDGKARLARDTLTAASPPSTARVQPAEPVVGSISKDKQTHHSDDAEFQAIARYLFASGALDAIEVSSDEDEKSNEIYTSSPHR